MRPLILLLLALLSPVIFAANTSNNIIYGPEDIKTLFERAQWHELLLHMKDIRPSQRDQKWQEMVTKAALEYGRELRNLGPYTTENFNFLNSLRDIDFLASDEFFNIYHDDFTKKYIQNCLSSEQFEKCYKQALSYWENGVQNAELGRFLIENFYSRWSQLKETSISDSIFYLNTWKLLLPTVSSEHSEFYCNKQKHQKLLYNIFLITTLRPQSVSPLSISTISSNIHNNCWDQIKEHIESKILDNNFDVAKMAYDILKGLDKLSAHSQNLFLVRYYLQAPSKGELYNLAWSKVEELASRPEQRMALVTLISKLDPIPDQVFKINKNTTVVNHLYKNIPEFIDIYSKTCLGYLSGEKTYPNGNPTPSCDAFMKAANEQDILIPGQYKQFKIIKNL